VWFGFLSGYRSVVRMCLQSTLMSIPTCGVRPIPLDVRWEGLAGNCLSERNLRFLCESPLLPGLQCRAHQIFHFWNWARTELGIEMTIDSSERAFKCRRPTVREALRNGYSPPKEHGPHLTAAWDCEADIFARITKNSEKAHQLHARTFSIIVLRKCLSQLHGGTWILSSRALCRN
jgi:hypothetical protein